jgi:hypothetical protein
MLFRVQPTVGASRAEATDKQAEHNALVPLDGGLAILSGRLDFDLLTLPLNKVMAHRTEPKLQRMQTRYRSMTGELLTLRQGAQPWPDGRPAADGEHAGRRRRPARGLFRLRRRRGFMLSPIYSPARPRSSSTWWCPNCSGAAFRRKYAGFTQRDHLGQDS